jgi:hypothetical protein
MTICLTWCKLIRFFTVKLLSLCAPRKSQGYGDLKKGLKRGEERHNMFSICKYFDPALIHTQYNFKSLPNYRPSRCNCGWTKSKRRNEVRNGVSLNPSGHMTISSPLGRANSTKSELRCRHFPSCRRRFHHAPSKPRSEESSNPQISSAGRCPAASHTKIYSTSHRNAC